MDLKSSSANTLNYYITKINKSTITAVQQRSGTPVTFFLVYQGHIFDNHEHKNNYFYSLRVPVRVQMYVLNH